MTSSQTDDEQHFLIDHAEFKSYVTKNYFNRIHCIGSKEGDIFIYGVLGKDIRYYLASNRDCLAKKELRNPDTAINLMAELGAVEYDLDLSNWDENQIFDPVKKASSYRSGCNITKPPTK